MNTDLSNQMPQKDSKWQHRNGVVYTVLGVSNTESVNEKHPPDVIYVGESGSLWSRPLSDWHRSMTPQPSKKIKPG